jgi:hypothetical protein
MPGAAGSLNIVRKILAWELRHQNNSAGEPQDRRRYPTQCTRDDASRISIPIHAPIMHSK